MLRRNGEHTMSIIIDTINTILDAHHLDRLRPKNTRTHGGEWYAPCPRCKVLGTGGKNEDRLLVWPERPAFGAGSRDNPCFSCRVCRSDEDATKWWSGDLASFYMWAHGMEKEELPTALQALGIDTRFQNKTEVLFKSNTSLTGAPDDEWQTRGSQLVVKAFETLWSEEGTFPLHYLTVKRGIREDIVRKFVLGCVTETYYEDGALWGRPNTRIKIPRGIVFPEYHDIVLDGVHQRELWSIVIRIPDADIEDEFLETGKRPEKYHAIAGSHKGLYLGDTIAEGKGAVLEEGHLDALTTYQEIGDMLGVGATMSAAGARSSFWIGVLNLAEYVLLCLDPDATGDSASSYWLDILGNGYDWSFETDKDINKMHVDGESVRSFFLEAVKLHEGTDYSLREATVVESVQNDISGSETVTLSDLALSDFGAEEFSSDVEYDLQCDGCNLSFDPVTMRYDQDGKALCIRCQEKCLREATVVESVQNDIPMHQASQSVQISLSDDNLDGQENHASCLKCGEPAYYIDAESFCREDFAASQLMIEGEKISWEGFSFLAGRGLVHPVQEIWEDADAGHVRGGYRGYIAFIQEASRAQIWVAMFHAHCIATKQLTPLESAGKIEREKKAAIPKEFLCVHQGCGHDYRKPYQMFHDQVKKSGKQWADWDDPYKYKPVRGVFNLLDGKVYHWCARCVAGSYVLDFGEELGYPQIGYGTIHIFSGAESWIEHVTHATDYENTVAFDYLRRIYPEAFQAIAELHPDSSLELTDAAKRAALK